MVNVISSSTDQLINQIALVNTTIGVEWQDIEGYTPGGAQDNLALCALVYGSELIDEQHDVNATTLDGLWIS